MEELIKSLKEELRIEEADRFEDGYLSKIITTGKKRIEGLIGVSLLFEESSEEYDLLMTFGRYYYNNAEEYFEENNSKEILRLQLNYAIRDRKKNHEE